MHKFVVSTLFVASLGIFSTASANLSPYIHTSTTNTACDPHNVICDFFNMPDPQSASKVIVKVNGEVIPELNCSANDTSYYMTGEDINSAISHGINTGVKTNMIEVVQCMDKNCTKHDNGDNDFKYEFTVKKADHGYYYSANPPAIYNSLLPNGQACS